MNGRFNESSDNVLDKICATAAAALKVSGAIPSSILQSAAANYCRSLQLEDIPVGQLALVSIQAQLTQLIQISLTNIQAGTSDEYVKHVRRYCLEVKAVMLGVAFNGRC